MEDRLNEKITEKVDEMIETITKKPELKNEDIDKLGKLVDIKTDTANQKYWDKKEEVYDMRYSDRSYGRRCVPGTGRRYRGEYEGEYGRRGVKGTGRGHYRGEDAIDEMHENYGRYNDAMEDADYGTYGAEDEMVKSVEGIMKNVYEIVCELSETGNPEVMQIIKKYARKMGEM